VAKSVFSITPSETVSFLPIILLAIIFGLSSDYEVFVVSGSKKTSATPATPSAPCNAGPG